MKIIEYHRLDTRQVKQQYDKTVEMLKKDDFRSAEVKKLAPTPYYRAKLDYTNRLLFKIVDYQNEKYALILEVIRQHAYDKSKFLRGAAVNEDHIVSSTENLTSEPISYINHRQPNLHILDKLISFDDTQQDILQLPCPVIIIGSAGSGKTALTLEKMKQCQGNIAYITHSSYLAHNSRTLFYANPDGIEDQNAAFLSFREFLETIQIPRQQEITFPIFRRWIERSQQTKLARDSHALYEEFRGVISGTSAQKPYLTREEYLNLGVKQSIFLQENRKIVYDLYERYRQFLVDSNYYDINLVSFAYLSQAEPCYDFIVIDEIQDFTNIQLLLMLRTLKNPNHFILCGDSNQIVHPNFFSWAKIKTLCYHGEIDLSRDITRILYTNYRCGLAITQLSNLLLKIKQARFGSIDRESNYLVETNASYTGETHFLHEAEKNVTTLNNNSKKSTHYAVIVLRDDIKEKAKRLFQTPLVFSVHEAKGLEYDNIILYDFISSETKAFSEIASGISEDVLLSPLNYARGKDKTDRSLEIYKFYINALYVAVTRAVRHIYWVESARTHPLLDLLGIKESTIEMAVDNQQSSIQEWQQEARKLELQGKQEQADAIRSQIVKEKTVPWEVLTPEKAKILAEQALRKEASKQSKIDLLEYALVYHHFNTLSILEKQGLKAASNPQKSLDLIYRKYYDNYQSTNLTRTIEQINAYGVDLRNRFNQTLLMIAAYIGNKHLLTLAISSGANIQLVDNNQYTAFQIALYQAITNRQYAQKQLEGIYYQLASDSLDIQFNDKLIKIDLRNMEYLMFHIANLLLEPIDRQPDPARLAVISAEQLTRLFLHFPTNIMPDYRKKRAYLSRILAKNEINGSDLYNRKLFKRLQRGYYIINPDLKIKINGKWVDQQPNKVQDKQNKNTHSFTASREEAAG